MLEPIAHEERMLNFETQLLKVFSHRLNADVITSFRIYDSKCLCTVYATALHRTASHNAQYKRTHLNIMHIGQSKRILSEKWIKKNHKSKLFQPK